MTDDQRDGKSPRKTARPGTGHTPPDSRSHGRQPGEADETSLATPSSSSPAGEDETRLAPPDAGGDRPTAAWEPGGTRTGVPGAASSSPSAGTLAVGAEFGRRYVIIANLGQGGMGEVYKAYDRELDRNVALKLIRPEMASNPEILERFKREILLASRVTHKNVVRIHDLGEAEGIKYISMHFVEGETLKDLLEREGSLSVDRAIPILRQVIEALQAAHDAGVVHRDLKPANIMVDAEGNAFIADFGISRSLDLDAKQTQTGMLLGTVAYMSPEQARGEHVDSRSDLYSLGLIIYEVLSGKLPFESPNSLTSLMRRVERDAPTIRSVRPDLPPWVAAVIARALQRDPAARYQSATEVLRDLERHRASRDWKKLLRPKPLAVAAVSVIVLVLLGALVSRYARMPAGQQTAGGQPAGPVTSLIVLPLDNQTGDTRYDWTRTGLPSLLRTDLLRHPSLRLVGEERQQQVLGSLNLGGAGEMRESDLLRVAGLVGAENLLATKLFRAGESFRIEATLERVGVSSLVPGGSFTVSGAGEEALFTMMDELSGKVSQALGAGKASGDTDASRLSTRSVEALRLYGEGLSLKGAGSNLEAASKLEEALQADPKFAMAGALLAETYDGLGLTQKAAEAADRAVAGLADSTGFEATRLRAVVARIKGDYEAAETAYRAVCDALPNSPDAWYDLGTVQESNGDLEGALTSLERAAGLDAKSPTAQYALGRVLVKLGRPEEGLSRLTTARDLQRESGNDEGLATVLNGLGNVYLFSLGRYDTALEHYDESLQIRERIGDRQGVAAVLNNIAVARLYQGKFDESIETSLKAESIWKELGNQRDLATCYSNLGDAYVSTGKLEQASEAYNESLNLSQTIGDKAGQARAASNLGSIYVSRGSFVQAAFWQNEALKSRRELGNRREIIRSLVDVGITEQFMGKYEDAIRHYVEGESIARDLDDKAQALALRVNLSNIHEEQGDYGAALRELDEADDIAAEIKDDYQLAVCRTYQGSLLMRIGDYEGSRKALDVAEDLLGKAPSPALDVEARVVRGWLLMATGEKQAARSVLEEASRSARELSDFRLGLMTRLALSVSTGSESGVREVVAEADKAQMSPLEASARTRLARLLLDQGKAPAAGKEAEIALDLATRLGRIDLVFQCDYILATAAVRNGDSAAATRLSRAIDPLERMTESLRAADPAALKAFLSRPLTVEFVRKAREVLGKADAAEDLRRIEGLLTTTAAGS